MILYGDYVKYEDGVSEDELKKILKKQMYSLIDILCEKEGFFIKVERDKTGKDLLRQSNTMGWKIAVPHMENAPKD